jgi:hypothetical protein
MRQSLFGSMENSDVIHDQSFYFAADLHRFLQIRILILENYLCLSVSPVARNKLLHLMS